ncbi:MAG: DUF5110 domain-containing protein [Clostridia bacterium]|nr:DUF5110 domain-containing protein [Clostridia bacterium]
MIVFEKNDLRISLITPRLLRTEKGIFTDLPTQTVQNREFGDVNYSLSEQSDLITVTTDAACFAISKKNGDVTSVFIEDTSSTVVDFSKGMLPGTARTLDTANGAVKLENGITSLSGASVMDDSKSLLINPDGSISPRPKCSDRYWFAYGHDYLGQLRDFFKLTGEVPLIPKYALGNWWSRYRAYTQEEYRSLMQKFIDRQLPITVATIDMDWHWTDVLDRFGEDARSAKPTCPEELMFYHRLQGWTGYSWNTELFPNYRELLSWLHNNGFKITLNIHPSQGVRFFEDQYKEMCERLGRDPEKKEIIPFDPTDMEFMSAYFDILHHPYEDEGVDFWWIDWQQGTKTKIPGLDPLWALNHYHSLDSARGDNRPLILSRYAGLGSHRYPLGFSGDTLCTWKSLDFQPYFTNSAANAGYTWWSHDIGGHTRGVQDDELYLRWLQYGVFSPINRLHSSNSDFMGKEPWKRSYAVCQVAEEFLRLRHKMIPYLYTANYRTHTVGEPICMPMYYRYDCPEAYETKNQFIFGGNLIVCPITRPADMRLNLAYTEAWLPEGRFTDIFNGRIYEGGKKVRLYRDIDSIPVLAAEGTILPMYRDGRSNDLSLDQPLEIHVWRGNGGFDLYEDDGETNAYKNGNYVITSFKLEEHGDSIRLIVTPPKDSKGLLPSSREMYIKFRDIYTEEIKITLSNEPVVIELNNIRPMQNEDKNEIKSEILTRVQGSNDKKSFIYHKKLPRFVRDALTELDAFYIPVK